MKDRGRRVRDFFCLRRSGHAGRLSQVGPGLISLICNAVKQ